MSERAIKKSGHYRLYKEGGIYAIYSGTKSEGVHVENIAHIENFEWAIEEIKSQFKREFEAEFGKVGI